MFRRLVAVAGLLLLANSLFPGATGYVAEGYSYPITDPVAATVIGAPRDYRARSPEARSERRTLAVFPGRHVPDILAYARELKYTTAFQDHPAPLVFLISGTGGERPGTEHGAAHEPAFR